MTVLAASVVPAVQQATYTQTGGTTLVITRTALGPTGNTFTLAASTTPASNGTVSGAALTGGANSHTFVSATQNLPSMSIEVGLPDVPFFGMNYGARANSLSVQAQRSGLLSATVNVIAQGEATAIATAAGTPTVLDVERFSQFQGSITRNGAVLGNIVSAELMYSNNLEKIEVIRCDGRIADIDPGIVKCAGLSQCAVSGYKPARSGDRTHALRNRPRLDHRRPHAPQIRQLLRHRRLRCNPIG